MMKPASVLSKQLHDIQAMLNSGFGWLTNSRFWLLTIRDGQEDRARAWLSELARSNLMVSAQRVLKGKENSNTCETVAIAFSFVAGLTKLGLRENQHAPISDSVSQRHGEHIAGIVVERQTSPGMAVVGRRRTSGAPDGAHIVVANWRSPDAQRQMPSPDGDGFCAITAVENRPGSFKDGKLYEPFGFRDGVAQPVIRGLRDEDGDKPKRVRQEAGLLYEDRIVVSRRIRCGLS